MSTKFKLLSAATILISTLALPAMAMAQGVLKVALTSNLNTLDPAKTKIGDEYIVNYLVYSGLTEIGQDGKVAPDLAESWTVSDDLKTWTFKLKPGVTFHSGRQLDAEDVKVTIERIMSKDIGSVARVNFLLVDKIEVVDPLTIRFSLTIPYAGFAELFADRQVRIIPRDKVATIATQPDGTGPFVFKQFRPGSDVSLVKNPKYFLAGKPKLDGVDLKIMPEAAARISAITTREVDLVWDLPHEAVSQLSGKPGIVVDSVATSSWEGLIMNGKTAPFDNPKVRLAIASLIDRKAMVEFSLFGNGSATLTMIPPSHPYFDRDIPIPQPDVAKAKALLAEAGFSNGLKTVLYYPAGRPSRERLALAAKEMLALGGIEVDLQRVPSDKFFADIEGKAAFYVDSFYSRPAIDPSVYPWFHSSGSWNSTLWNYHNPKVDEVLDKARVTTSDDEKSKLYKEFQKLVIETPPGVIPYVMNHANAVRSNVKGFRTSPFLWLDLRDTYFQ